MKRLRFDEEIDCRPMDMAGTLMLLSRGRGGDREDHHHHQPSVSPPRVFQCKTCSRQFQSFQALGGHRASHKKPRAGGVCSNAQAKPRAHGCSVCGLEFAIGQALGGHMRRHRAHEQSGGGGRGGGGEEKRAWFDLNLPPSETYETKNVHAVDCFL